MKTTAMHPDIRLYARLRSAVVDSSSIIYMEKAGFFTLLARQICLLTIPEVIEETGYGELPVVLVRVVPLNGPAPEKRRNDRLIAELATARGLPIIAEDRKILLEADRKGLLYFNALMMLNFLLWKHAMSLEEHSLYFSRLLESARYGKNILAYSREVFEEVRKGL